MRTTVTLDPDTRALVERRMRERGVSFKVALNDAIRSGHRPSAPESFTVARDLGEPRVDLTKALGLSATLEDDELARRLGQRR